MLTAGSGVDTINILSNARIMRDARLKLGDGDNICTFEGDVKRSLQIQVGAGIDTVTIAEQRPRLQETPGLTSAAAMTD